MLKDGFLKGMKASKGGKYPLRHPLALTKEQRHELFLAGVPQKYLYEVEYASMTHDDHLQAPSAQDY